MIAPKRGTCVGGTKGATHRKHQAQQEGDQGAIRERQTGKIRGGRVRREEKDKKRSRNREKIRDNTAEPPNMKEDGQPTDDTTSRTVAAERIKATVGAVVRYGKH